MSGREGGVHLYIQARKDACSPWTAHRLEAYATLTFRSVERCFKITCWKVREPTVTTRRFRLAEPASVATIERWCGLTMVAGCSQTLSRIGQKRMDFL